MKRETTAGQQRVLEFIQETIRENGVAPTLQEIAGRFEKSTGAILRGGEGSSGEFPHRD